MRRLRLSGDRLVLAATAILVSAAAVALFTDPGVVHSSALITMLLVAAAVIIGRRRQRFEDQALLDYQLELESRVEERTEDLLRVISDMEAEVLQHQASAIALLATERQLSQAQEISHIGSVECNLITGRVVWSDEVFRIHGYEPDSVTPSFRRFVKNVHAADRRAVTEALLVGIRDAEPQNGTYRLLCGGVEKTVHYRVEIFRDDAGQPARLIGTIQDLTEWYRSEDERRTALEALCERELTERELRIGRERLELLARATNDVLCDWDLVNGSLWWGENAHNLLGDSETVAGDLAAWTARLHPEDHNRVVESMLEAISAGKDSWAGEYRLRRSDQTYVDVFDRRYVLRDESGTPVRMVGAIIDVSERKQLEAQLERANRVSSLGRIAASMAHEFNNVLMGMQPFVELIRRRSTDNAIGVSAESLLKSISRGKRITEQILGFSRPIQPVRSRVHVAPALLGMEEELMARLGPSIQLRMEVPDADLYVDADAAQLAQIFTNLALNARDAMPGGGELVMSATRADASQTSRFNVIARPERFVHFVVRDTGAGIPVENLDSIFEPLFTTKANGTGLGLAITHQIVRSHGGHIFVESAAGIGTTFHLFLPLAERSPEKVRPPTEGISIAGVKILLVEDEPFVAEGVQLLLEQEGADVRVVQFGSEAVPVVAEFGPDVVVLDVGLPDIDGVEVFHRLAARWPDLPVIFSSGHADASNIAPYLRASRIAFLQKPYEFSALRRMTADVLQATHPV